MNEQNSNPFGDLSTEGLEKSGDFLGGGGAIDSGVYTGEIKLVFVGKSDGGAHFLEVHVDLPGGRPYRERLWVKGKNGLHYYERNGKKSPLPGFTVANDLALLSTGFDLSGQTFEEKIVKLYDFDAKMEVPTKVQAITSMMGQSITIGVLKQTVDKNVKDSTGAYVPSGETRDENAIDKVFHTETGKTVSELSTLPKDAPAEFQAKWDAKNKGQTRMKAKGAEGKTGTPGAIPTGGGAKPATSKSLFG